MNVSPEIVRRLREERGWTQEQLAKACNVNARTIQRAEKDGQCSLETRAALVSVFKVNSAHLGSNAIDLVQYFLTYLGEELKVSLPISEAEFRQYIQDLAKKVRDLSPKDCEQTASDVINAICRALGRTRLASEKCASSEDEIRAVNRLSASLAQEILGRMVRLIDSVTRQPGIELVEMHENPQLTVFAAYLEAMTGAEVEIQERGRSGILADDLVEYPKIFKILPPPNGLATYDLNAMLWALHMEVTRDVIRHDPALEPYTEDYRNALEEELTNTLAGCQDADGKPKAVGLYLRDPTGGGSDALLALARRFDRFPPVAYLHEQKDRKPTLQYLVSPSRIAAKFASVLKKWLEPNPPSPFSRPSGPEPSDRTPSSAHPFAHRNPPSSTQENGMSVNISVNGHSGGPVMVNTGDHNVLTAGNHTITARSSELDDNLRGLLEALQSKPLKPEASHEISVRLDSIIEALKEQTQAPSKNPGKLCTALGELKHVAEYIIAADIVQHYAGWIGNFLDKLKS